MKILNSTFEVALRLLAILSTCKRKMSVERLAAYSYFALYLSDLVEEEASLHPEIPYRSSSYIKSKEVILPAIELLMSKGLVSCTFNRMSINFFITELGVALYDQMEGSYKLNLEANIHKAHELMKKKTDKALNTLIYKRMAEWGSEFSYESVFKGWKYEE